MNKILTLLLLTLSLIKVYAQELNAQFVVNADLVNEVNPVLNIFCVSNFSEFLSD